MIFVNRCLISCLIPAYADLRYLDSLLILYQQLFLRISSPCLPHFYCFKILCLDMIPKVAVLLASYNGERYIIEQIESISRQVEVEPSIFISDDGSTDQTFSQIKQANVFMPGRIFFLYGCRPQDLSKPCSANNFYYLVSSLDLPACFHWVAFADQDDVWDPRHLKRAISILGQDRFAGYSSSVIAFWPDGRKKLVNKNGRASTYNHLFEAPGPGCSFVLPRSSFDLLQAHLKQNLSLAAKIDFHDWAIFAYIKVRCGSWFIDSWPSLHYRQHHNNVLGVQLTARTVSLRLKMLLGSWYRNQCIAVADFAGQPSSLPAILLRRFSFSDRLSLAWIVFSSRRRLRDRLLLPLAFLLMPNS